MRLILAFLISLVPTMALADELKTNGQVSVVRGGTNESITVIQAIGVGNALKALSLNYVVTDKDGKQTEQPYKFSAHALGIMASDLEQTEIVQNSYNRAHNALVRQYGGSVPAENDPKRVQFNDQEDQLLNAPANIKFSKISERELCLENNKPCDGANPIKIVVLTLLRPMIEK